MKRCLLTKLSNENSIYNVSPTSNLLSVSFESLNYCDLIELIGCSRKKRIRYLWRVSRNQPSIQLTIKTYNLQRHRCSIYFVLKIRYPKLRTNPFELLPSIFHLPRTISLARIVWILKIFPRLYETSSSGPLIVLSRVSTSRNVEPGQGMRVEKIILDGWKCVEFAKKNWLATKDDRCFAVEASYFTRPSFANCSNCRWREGESDGRIRR